ncbi:MAG: tRNA (adenosine(37)-N6)-dimethylallyltransferase MiaA [bacterium]|nr:tRNA (adenosine(37)-N6)-dimethylallyltransferase MiaA [bacterium]
MNKKLPKLIVVIGATASGKSELAREIASRFGGEIISADARQVYRGMDIGTAKDTAPQHLVDIRHPDEPYTVADFQHDAIAVIRDIHARGKLPILVGGTGLYVNAVVDNLTIPKVTENPELRKRLEEKSADELLMMLNVRDPHAASLIDPHNKRRIIRALEIIETTGSLNRTKGEPLFDTLMLGITIPREELYQRINARVDSMMQEGFLNEVRALLQKYPPSAKAFDAIGYRELIAWITSGEKEPLETIAEKIKSATRAYARRQLTWWRHDEKVQQITTKEEAIDLISKNLLSQP